MPTIGTVLQYNNIYIYGCELIEFSQTGVLDDSGADRLYDSVMIRVRGMVHTSLALTHGTSSTKAGLVLRTNELQANLMTPRKLFNLYVDNQALPGGGSNLFLSVDSATLDFNAGVQTDPAFQTLTDVCNGPHPVEFKIIKVVSNKTFKIEFAIRVCIITCADSEGNSQGVLSNRWGWTDIIDRDWFTKRICRGRLRVASANIDPNSFRSQIMPPLQLGFRRALIEVTTTTDGLNMDYTVVDEQTTRSAPFPLSTLTGTHSVTQQQNGAVSIITLSLVASAPPDVPKVAILATLSKIAADRLNFESQEAAAMVHEFTLTDFLDETTNRAGLSAVFQVSGNITNSQFAVLDSTRLGKDFTLPNYDKKKSTNIPPFGTTDATGLLICFLQDPCGDNHSFDLTKTTDDSGESTASTSENDGTVIVNNTTDTLTDLDQPTNVSEDHKSAQYTHYAIDSHFPTVPMRAQMALGTASGGDANQDTSTVVALARGQVSRRIIRVEAERLGAAPVFPSFGDFTDPATGIKHYLMDTRPVVAAPERSADGVNFMHSLTLELVYAMSRPLGSTETLSVGAMPWDKATKGQLAYNLGSLSSNEII